MDVREKLVELANDVLRYLPWGEIQKDTAERMAERMMDHGVTVQEWIPVTERLPDKGVVVLVSDGSDYPEVAELVLRTDGRLIWADGNFREVKYITHWMPLPQPPKGE